MESPHNLPESSGKPFEDILQPHVREKITSDISYFDPQDDLSLQIESERAASSPLSYIIYGLTELLEPSHEDDFDSTLAILKPRLKDSPKFNDHSFDHDMSKFELTCFLHALRSTTDRILEGKNLTNDYSSVKITFTKSMIDVAGKRLSHRQAPGTDESEPQLSEEEVVIKRYLADLFGDIHNRLPEIDDTLKQRIKKGLTRKIHNMNIGFLEHSDAFRHMQTFNLLHTTEPTYEDFLKARGSEKGITLATYLCAQVLGVQTPHRTSFPGKLRSSYGNAQQILLPFLINFNRHNFFLTSELAIRTSIHQGFLKKHKLLSVFQSTHPDFFEAIDRLYSSTFAQQETKPSKHKKQSYLLGALNLFETANIIFRDRSQNQAQSEIHLKKLHSLGIRQVQELIASKILNTQHHSYGYESAIPHAYSPENHFYTIPINQGEHEQHQTYSQSRADPHKLRSTFVAMRRCEAYEFYEHMKHVYGVNIMRILKDPSVKNVDPLSFLQGLTDTFDMMILAVQQPYSIQESRKN